MRQLQGMDASFVALETRNSPMHIGSILVYNPETAPGSFVRFKDILQFIGARAQLSRTMRQRLVRVPFDLDYPYWVEDPDFDLEYHVRHVALPRPGDWRQLCIQAARIFARPLDLDRPPWEFTVIEGLDNVPGVTPGSFAMVTKVHHAAIDGMSGIDLMEALHTLRPGDPPPNKPDTWKPERIPNPIELLGKSYFNAVTNPWKQLEVAAKAAPGLAKAIKGLVVKDFTVSADMLAPKSRFNRKISPHRVVEGRSFKLADIKAIRALAEGAKVNDVFLAIIGGAMRKYLLAKDDLPKKTLTAMAPISVRSGGEKGDMGNQVAAMIAPLGTHIDDPAERLAFVFSQTANSQGDVRRDRRAQHDRDEQGLARSVHGAGRAALYPAGPRQSRGGAAVHHRGDQCARPAGPDPLCRRAARKHDGASLPDRRPRPRPCGAILLRRGDHRLHRRPRAAARSRFLREMHRG